MRGRVSPLSGLARLPIIIGNPACGRPVCPWGRVCPLSCLSRPLIYKKKPCLRPAWLSVGTRLLLLLKGNLAATGPPMCGDVSVPYLTSPVLLLIRRNPACGRPVCPWDAFVPCLAPLVLLLLKREPTCDRPSYVRGRICPLSDLSRPLINKKKPFLRPAWGRVCPLSCPSRPLIVKKGTYLRPALLRAGTLIIRNPACGRLVYPWERVCTLSYLSRPAWERVCPMYCKRLPLFAQHTKQKKGPGLRLTQGFILKKPR